MSVHVVSLLKSIGPAQSLLLILLSPLLDWNWLATEANAGSILNDNPRMSLHCKLVPVQNRGDENGHSSKSVMQIFIDFT